MKRVLSLILTLCMIVSTVGVIGITVSADTHPGICGDNLTWSLDTETGVLTIEGTGDMYDYTYSDFNGGTVAPWRAYPLSVRSVVIKDSVTSISDYAFYGCANLDSVVIPDSVVRIGTGVFSGTAYYNDKNNWSDGVLYIGNHLIKADHEFIEDGSSLAGTYTVRPGTVTIAPEAFSRCQGLKKLILPDSLVSIGRDAFYECQYLAEIELPDSLKSIGTNAFYECISLKSIVIPESMTEISDNLFYFCSGLKSVTLPDTLTRIGYGSFVYCWSLENLEIPESVTEIEGYAFAFSSGVSDIKIPDGITSIEEYTFQYSDLTNIIIPDSVTSIGKYAFTSCNLKSITLPDSVTSIGEYAFCDCTSLIEVTIPDSVTSIGKNAFHYYNNGYKPLLDLTIKCYKDSYAYTYAVDNEIPFELLHTCKFTNYISDNNYTCTEDGTKTAYCDNGCGASDTVVDEGSAGHRYTREEILREPTCTRAGYKMLLCDCGARKNETISAVDHSYSKYSYNDDATCTEDGTETAYCDYGCGAFDIRDAKGTMLIHRFTDYVYNNDATCSEEGTETAYCDYGCGASDTRIAEGTKGDHSYIEEILEESTCTTRGFALYFCDCGDFYTVDLPLTDHKWSDWTETKAPTDAEAGEEQRKCSACGKTEIRELPVLPKPEISVNNYTITITNADHIKDMRYVLGTYTTTTEIRNAEGNVALDNGVVTKNTIDGKFVYEMPNGGMYSIWIRMQDGTNYILPLDMTKFTPTVDTYGVKITVDGLYDAKDFFIAKGQFNSYNEIKNNGYIVRVTENKIAGKHNYTYTVSDPGMHTVLVRYNDGTENIFHEELTVDEPTFTTNGLQVTVGNIPDVKVIRTAYGEYYTPGDTKRAEGARNFSNKAVIKDAETYMLQYREEGRVTIIVEYNNGYVKVFHYDVVKKAPTVEQNENSVTFGNLDGLVMIRYAVGEYSTSAEIKRVPGSKVIKPDAIVDGKITVSDLTVDNIYTFCVQYDDESYCYYQSHIKVEQKDFTLNFNAEDGALVNNADLTYGINIGDKYSDIITELPVAEKEGYVFKGWWNRQRRIALTPDFDAEKVFDVFLWADESVDTINKTIELIPIWDTEGEKDWTLTFDNYDIEGFETITYGINVGDLYMSIFAGEFPDPGEKVYEFDGDIYEFRGWLLEHPDIGVFLLTEGDMWDLGWLTLEGDWAFYAFYEII